MPHLQWLGSSPVVACGVCAGVSNSCRSAPAAATLGQQPCSNLVWAVTVFAHSHLVCFKVMDAAGFCIVCHEQLAELYAGPLQRLL